MGAVNLKIDQLLLHSENPRIGSASNQRDAMQKILDDQEEKIAVLAESIVTDGMSPIDRLLVIREKPGGKRFAVLEGNRRTCALKILANPAVLDSLEIANNLQKRLVRLSVDFDRSAIEPIECYEVTKGEDYIKWIYLRHTGENDGRGVVRWTGLARRRFLGKDPALQALEFVQKHGNLDAHQEDVLVKNFPITTLDRLLSTKSVRSFIGLDIKNRRLLSGLPGDELMKPLRRLVLDLAEKKINVSELKNSAEQLEYIKSFDANNLPDLSKARKVRSVQDFSDKDFKIKPKTAKPKKKGKPDPSKRKCLAPARPRLNVSIAKAAEIYTELRGLPMEKRPHSCAVLLRVFLELSVDYYLKKNQIPLKFKAKGGRVVDKKLREKIKEVVDHLVKQKNCDKKDFDGIYRGLTDKGSPLYIDLLHAYIHSLFQTPKARDLRVAWDEAEPFFIEIWN